jgi:hypothetical protein
MAKTHAKAKAPAQPTNSLLAEQKAGVFALPLFSENIV